jgi:hypothetical protein
MTATIGLAAKAAGAALLVVGFGFHFLGQALSLHDWSLAERLGLQEKDATAAQQDYERGFAVADVLIGWLYGPIAIGLWFEAPWAFKAAFLPGVVFTYHAVGFWFWTARQARGGRPGIAGPKRVLWAAVNLACGLLLLGVAWVAANP